MCIPKYSIGLSNVFFSSQALHWDGAILCSIPCSYLLLPIFIDFYSVMLRWHGMLAAMKQVCTGVREKEKNEEKVF